MPRTRPAWKAFPELEYVIGQKPTQHEIAAEETKRHNKKMEGLALAGIIALLLTRPRRDSQRH